MKSYSDTIELANKTQEIQRASDEKDITLDFQVKQLAKLSPEKIGSSFEMFLSEKISSNELNLNPDELSKINFTNAGRRLMFDEIIEPTLMSIRSDLKEYPQIQYSLFKRSFSLTFNLGFFDKSLLILDEVSQLIENKSLEKDKMFQVLKQKAGVLTSMNEVVQALNILEEVCNQIGVFKGKENKDYYDCQFRYASTLFSTNDKQKALNLMAETIEKLKTNEITDKALLVRMLNNYATGVTNYKFDFIHAHSLYSEAYSLSNEIHGEQHIMTLHILDNLGNSLRNLKDYERAYKYSEKVYELRKIKLGSDHIDTLFSLKNLAIILIEIGETDKALKKINHIINTLTENSSQDSSLLLTVSNTKSYIYSVQKKYNEAIDLLKNSLIRHIEFYGHNSSEVAYVYKQLAEVNLEMGQTANAKKYFVIALGLIMEIYGENDRDSIEIKSVLEQI